MKKNKVSVIGIVMGLLLLVVGTLITPGIPDLELIGLGLITYSSGVFQ